MAGNSELLKFFNDCIKAGCVVIPVELFEYSKTGNPLNSLGIRFFAVECDGAVSDADPYYEMERSFCLSGMMFDSPEEALDWFVRRNDNKQENT